MSIICSHCRHSPLLSLSYFVAALLCVRRYVAAGTVVLMVLLAAADASAITLLFVSDGCWLLASERNYQYCDIKASFIEYPTCPFA